MIDVNGTRYHLLLGAADWARCAPEPGRVALGDEVTLQRLLFRFPAPAGAAAGDPAARRRGAARDRYGNWYWIDEGKARVVARSAHSVAPADFWPVVLAAATPPLGAFTPAEPPPARPPCRFGGLAVTEDHYLVVGTVDEPGLLVFDLHAGGRPRHLRWPDGVPFEPFDLAAAPGGGLFVLDRVHRRLWALDRRLGVIEPPALPAPPGPFGPADGSPDDLRPPARRFPEGITLDSSSPLGASDPVAIEALPDGTVLVLDRGADAARVLRHRLAELLSSVVLDVAGLLEVPPAPGEPLFGADLAFVAGGTRAADQLVVPAADGVQAFAFAIVWKDAPLALSPSAGGALHGAPFLPMRLFGGKGLVAAGGLAYYDLGVEAWVPLVEQKRLRFVREGELVTPALDGREPGCVWHRLFLDGCIPAQARVEVASRVADEKADLERVPWSPEPAPRARRPELPLVAGEVGDTHELLFQRARGRWLQLRLRLRGDGRSSPQLRALRVWYPRFSYLTQYLPAVYRDDAESASFLDRFLANLEGELTAVEDRMAVAHLLFDARTAPPEALDWLAGWLGVALDPAWDEGRRRLFLRHAMAFFRMRGTTRGLRAALRLALDGCAGDDVFAEDRADRPASIRILEHFRLRRMPGAALGDPDAGAGIRQTSAPPRWTPEQGGAALRELYGAATFPVFEPADSGAAAAWHRFLLDVLSLSGTAGPGEEQAWHAFLAARYPTAAALNEAWNADFADASAVPLPAGLPPDGAPLFDWYQFQLGGGRFVAGRSRWIPAQGRAVLEDRWRQALAAAGLAPRELPLAEPAEQALAELWRRFVADVLGFTPAAGAFARAAWRDFLARRYRRVAALNAAHGTALDGFAGAELPARLPADGAPLRDWVELQSVAVAARQSAHRFTVLLPVPAREAFAVAQHQERRELARRIVALEKPAHTLFDVRFYWAMLRVGEARLAVDTLLDAGSRAPELMPPLVLGQGFLAESHLAGTPPERELERPILGGHALRTRHPTEEKRA